MKQLVQNLSDGAFSIVDSPTPARPPGFVLVSNHASLISSGTERSTVQAAQASLLGKARQRPDKVQQVLDNIRKEGVLATLQRVREKLDQPATHGYSSAGVVLAADRDERRFRVGDLVACGGVNYAVHAEIVSVPRNLVVRVPDGVPPADASFATVGSIALQGVRRAGVQCGDRVLVIGLGLLGQLTWQLVAHAGAIPIGMDVAAGAVELARQTGLRHACLRGEDDVEAVCAQLTEGHGVDAVIVTAAAKSRDPLLLAGAVSRERGRIVVVGAVPIDIPREPFYRKELDIVVSRSYGPGRYDPSYEEGGQDYPYGHVRWTEGRNMSAFLEAVACGGVRVAPLITHRFPIERAADAYDIVSGRRREPHVGLVLEYSGRPDLRALVPVSTVTTPAVQGRPGIAFIGAGSFARGSLLPHVRDRHDVNRVAVVTARGFTAIDAARKFGFAAAGTDAGTIIDDPRVHALFIATRHDQHAALTARALRAGKHVFVEKPLAVDEGQLGEVLAARQESAAIVQVGFNRRFSPLAVALRDTLGAASAPVQATYRVNAGPLPADHWLLDPRLGGGRVIGEGCHFVDLLSFLCGEDPVAVHASRFGAEAEGATTITLEFANGSVGVIVYQANASARVAKERLEAFAGGRGGVLDDWRSVELFEGRDRRVIKARGQAKGYAEEIAAFLSSLRGGAPAIPFGNLVATTAATFAALRSIVEGRVVTIAEVTPA